MILIGAGFMLTTILMALKILPILPRIFLTRWKVLTAFMCFFFLGYLFFIGIQVSKIPIPLSMVTGAVFLGGAIFVLLVLGLSRKIIGALIQREEQLEAINLEQEEKIQRRTIYLEKSLAEVDQLRGDLTQILDTISTGIRLIDTNFRIRMVNKSFCAMTGMSKEELIGSRCSQSFHDERCEDDALCTLKQLDAGNQVLQREVVKRTRDGRELHCLLTATPYRNNNGQVTGIVEDFQNISQRVRAEEERQEAQAQLLQRSKLESVGQLAAGIAHEINTPIQYVSTNIDFLAQSFADIDQLIEHLTTRISTEYQDKDLQQGMEEDLDEADWGFLRQEVPLALEQSRAGTEQVSAIVRAMKEFAHPGTKERQPTDLKKILDNTILISRNEWKYVAELETRFAPLPPVPCLREEMGQVFLNIIVNAAHAIDAQRKKTGTEDKGKITITTALRDGMAEIRIHDNGSGMNEETQQHIFEPFFTTKEVGQGTGQGLTIAHNIVTIQHHGTLSVESTPEQGTTFTILLPAP